MNIHILLMDAMRAETFGESGRGNIGIVSFFFFLFYFSFLKTLANLIQNNFFFSFYIFPFNFVVKLLVSRIKEKITRESFNSRTSTSKCTSRKLK